MIRTALRPRWLALLALLVAVLYLFTRLGIWQLSVSTDRAASDFAAQQAARPVVALETLTRPHQTFPAGEVGAPVMVEGTYVADKQFLVPERLLEGERGYWVVTPLRTDASGEVALIPVVRGFVTDPAQADEPAASPTTLTAALAPSESVVDTGPLPEGQRRYIDIAELTNVWDEPLYNGFLFMTGETPPVTSEQVVPVPVPVFGAAPGIDWRNVGYGIQWFIFGGFAIYMYLRFLQQAARAEREQPAEAPIPTTTGAPAP